MRNKTLNLKMPSPHPSLLLGLNFTPGFSPPPSLERHRGTGKGGEVCGQFITCCLLRGRTTHTLPLLQRGVPPTRDSLLWTSPT